MKEDACFIIGKIVGVHGVKGNLKVHPYIESISLLEAGETIFVGSPEDEEGKFVIRWAKPHHRTILMALADVEDRDAAEKLIGMDLFIEKSRLPDLEEGTYYWSDLVGLDVFTTDDRYLGKIASIFRTGSNDVYVARNGREETLIPGLASVVKSVDLEKGCMTVALPEGLM
ncbi:ribosome maturation factor RimM [Desulfococcus sp.]|uniref:ribosome maturation factor RimM n=1 Tax=Desulfococcus sp. TaxID=2025834 RepID=UPI0035935270